MSGKLIIICGLPGSGKSTHARSLERSQNAIRLCPDEWMDSLDLDLWDTSARDKVEKLQWSLAERLLELGQTVLIEWGTWGRDERDALRLRAKELGAAVELHYLNASLDVLEKRIKERGEGAEITREMLNEWADTFQRPSEQEGSLYDAYLMIENSHS